MAIYEQQTFPICEDTSACSPQVYPARRPPWPGSAEARAMTVGSGRQCSMWLRASDQLGAFSKILMESSLWANSQEYCYVWQRLDTKFACSAFRLTQLGPNTCDTGFSLYVTPLWQTPVADDSVERTKDKLNSRGEPKLSAQVKLWRTPNASDVSGGPMDGERRLAQGHQLNLSEQAATPKLWPTLTARDWKSCSPGNQDNSRPLSEVACQTGSGSLNPRFVEELMGFAIGYTDLTP